MLVERRASSDRLLEAAAANMVFDYSVVLCCSETKRMEVLQWATGCL